MIKIIRKDSSNKDFRTLVSSLDAYLAETDGEEHMFYNQFNSSVDLKYVIIAYEDGEAVGCGALKEYLPKVLEIKRMYVSPNQRGKGIATKILVDLESWAHEQGCEKCILETGKKQHAAVILYKSNGYKIIPSYGQYVHIENSLCFEKKL